MVKTRQPVGRAELLARAGAALAAGHGVVLVGPPGIGKSTILDTLASRSTAEVVLRCSAAEAEAELPYLALIDLFDGVPEAIFDTLPAHLRGAIDGALLRSVLPSTPYDQLAVCLAVLEVLRTLAETRTVMLVLDDLQWIDEPSAGVLRFVSRRIAGSAIGFVAAERVSGRMTAERGALCPQPWTELVVEPLTESEVADLLRDRFRGRLTRRDAQRVFLASSGNPLYAMELGRAFCERPGPTRPMAPLPVPDRLRGLLSARIATLPERERPILLLAAAAARPSVALLQRCGAAVEGELEAIRAGILVRDFDGAMRFSHPLLCEMVYADAVDSDRRAAHAALAEVVSDPVERARHLAIAMREPDELLARSLTEAAEAARLRGAPAAAADLAQLAAERTPDGDGAAAAARWLDAARHALGVGALAEATRHANAALALSADARVRIGARLLLIEMAGEDCSGIGPLLVAALAEANDHPDLAARLWMHQAAKSYYDGDQESALSESKRAEAMAEECHDIGLLVEILTWRGSMLIGSQRDDLLERSGQLARSLPLTPGVVSARQAAAMSPLFRGDVATAVERVTALHAEVVRSGAVREIAATLVSVAGVFQRAGRCAEALVVAGECARLFEDVMASPGPGQLVLAMAELNGGSPARALEYVERATVACQAAGDEGWIRHAYTTGGMIKLLLGDPHGAVEQMRQAYETSHQLGRIDPGQVLWHADYIEALVASGARNEAETVLAEVTSCAIDLGRQVALLGLARAGALVTAATGRARDGAEALGQAITRWADHPYPLEIARAYQVLGGLERRAHRRGAARAALEKAIRRFAQAEAIPWLEASRAELARLDGGRGHGLSETERRIVELVRAGATNREIARTLFLSVKAVEANLTRMYRRLNVRNRAQLARVLDSTE
ncbi:MAG: AAA family ATPase [Micromonosporaceae bacterium]|nr:AAA family ATPase [Micromonosporaceae bacterium]